MADENVKNEGTVELTDKQVEEINKEIEATDAAKIEAAKQQARQEVLKEVEMSKKFEELNAKLAELEKAKQELEQKLEESKKETEEKLNNVSEKKGVIKQENPKVKSKTPDTVELPPELAERNAYDVLMEYWRKKG